MTREGAHAPRTPFHWQQLLYAVLFSVLVTAGLYCGYLAYNTLRDFAAHTQFRSLPGLVAPTAQPEKAIQRPQEPGSAPQRPSQNIMVPDTQNNERVNILFMGIDQRPGESVACRTDTMMLVSIDPKDMSASILSIPRDLWIDIPHPSHDKDRINTAHYWGETEGYPGGGPALARKTIEYNFGVPVHYYARLNFVGFERIIDYIGGIDIDVPYTIDDDKYPGPNNGYTHLHIDAGLNHFDGETALKYARTRRGTGDGDFTRMERQQQVVLAIQDKVLSMKNLPQLIVQAPKLLREMGDSLETDMPVQEMFVLAEWAQQVDRDKIQTATISRDVTTDWWTPNGELVLLYDRARARPIIDALFSDPTPEAAAVRTTQVEQLEAESARVAIYNATMVEELGNNVQSFLAMQGIDVVEVQDLPEATNQPTTIKVYGEKPFTLQWLNRWLGDLGVLEPQIVYSTEYPDIDISITIGRDFPVEKLAE